MSRGDTKSTSARFRTLASCGRCRTKAGCSRNGSATAGRSTYLAPDKTLMAVGVDPAGASFDPDAPKPLFATRTLCLEIQTARIVHGGP